jgi:hypothetical protein
MRPVPALHGAALLQSTSKEAENTGMLPFLAVINKSSTVKLAEVGFLLILIAGLWLVAAEIPQLKLQKTRSLVAGLLLAVAGLLLLIATHWGKLV